MWCCCDTRYMVLYGGVHLDPCAMQDVAACKQESTKGEAWRPEKKEKKVGSFSAFLSSWGSPWSVSRQAPKEALLASRGGSGRWFWLGFGSGDRSLDQLRERRRCSREATQDEPKAIMAAQIRSVVMKSDPDCRTSCLPSPPSPPPSSVRSFCRSIRRLSQYLICPSRS